MNGGVIQLQPIYDLVGKCLKKNPADNAAYRINGKSSSGNAYRDECTRMVDGISEAQGFYLWGFYNTNKFWINVYCGKADKRRTANLKNRLYKELTAERAAIWRAFYKEPDILRLDPDYQTETKRAFRKAGSTHIFWVAMPESELDGANGELIESDLIEAMNPTGNRMRITPSPTPQNEALEILKAFREMIHKDENRNTHFHLKYHEEFWKNIGQARPVAP